MTVINMGVIAITNPENKLLRQLLIHFHISWCLASHNRLPELTHSLTISAFNAHPVSISNAPTAL